MDDVVCFIAAPLIARSGVYNSTVELVRCARTLGLDWRAVLGVSASAAGQPLNEDGIYEFEAEPGGAPGILNLARVLRRSTCVSEADAIVTMVPQADMATSLLGRDWIAYLRGLPWPARGEAALVKRMLWRALETSALHRAAAVWSTTNVLAQEAGYPVDRLVPPGISAPAERNTSLDQQREIVWAARYSTDKNPTLFFDAVSSLPVEGVMYGTGPLEASLRETAPPNVRIAGWAPPEKVWSRARVYVGTSSREAFGRSAVEAAMLGIPVVIADSFGCADMLYEDPDLAASFVLPIGDHARWRAAISRLSSDDELHSRVGEHLRSTATRLTIESAVHNVRSAIEAVRFG